MKTFVWSLLLVLLLPSSAIAGAREDYAQQWPLTLHDPVTGAYRAQLVPDVYRTVQSPSMADLDVVDADGARVPTELFPAEVPIAQARQVVDLPWFPLPSGAAARAPDIAVISERNADGSVQRVETRVGPASSATAAANAWLVDASRVRHGVAALELAWASGQTFDAAYRVEGSDDLRDWRVLQPHAQLMDLQRDGVHLLHARIALDGSAKYLRLLPEGGGATPALTGVRAQLGVAPAALAWSWRELAGTPREEAGVTWYDYTLDGRFPIERADLAVGGNSAGEWTLQSRDGDDAAWQTRAGPWVAYRFGAGASDRSGAQMLETIVRDRQWRLSSRTPVASAPTLRLGYRPEVVVFVAQGRAPFAVVAGSAMARRSDAPMARLIDAIRQARGDAWQPAPALLGATTPLAGASALQPRAAPRDWKAWLLWAVLIGGAALVLGFAVTLLRKPPTA